VDELWEAGGARVYLGAMAQIVSWAQEASERRLSPLGRRWTHVQRVAALADEVGMAFGEDHETLVAAAYLHDIGYAPDLAKTGFHPLDGARYVREQGHEQLARLVAHHSGARIEAQLRGITNYLTEFPFDDSDLDLALTYCDLTTGPDGSPVTLEGRVSEICERYGAEHTTSQAIQLGVPEFERARRETEQRLADAEITQTGRLADRRTQIG
jgi:hypothetical protein